MTVTLSLLALAAGLVLMARRMLRPVALICLLLAGIGLADRVLGGFVRLFVRVIGDLLRKIGLDEVVPAIPTILVVAAVFSFFTAVIGGKAGWGAAALALALPTLLVLAAPGPLGSLVAEGLRFVQWFGNSVGSAVNDPTYRL